MKSIKISEKIYWVGKVDDRKVPFHRLILEKGTTYNSYLLKTGMPTVIDTVDIAFGKEFVENLSEEIALQDIKYIVINHVEPDHAGALPVLAAKAKDAKIVTTELGAGLLKDMFKLHHREFLVVKDGDRLDIGGKTLKFYETPFLHTEETMVTYIEEDEILFPCDQFSTHIANTELFNDLAAEDYQEDFKVYYQLIMSPHRPYVRKMLEKIRTLSIKMIAPSHGYILRKDPEKYIDLYDEWSDLNNSKKDKKVLVIFSSMTGNTAKVAQSLVKGVSETGVDVRVFNIKNSDLEQLREEVAQTDGILVGSSTKYGDMIGNMEDFLKLLASGDNTAKLAAAFGSYGWSGEAVMHIEDYLVKSGFHVINQKYLIEATGDDAGAFPLRVRFTRDEDLKKAEEAGRIFGERLIAQ